MPRGHNPKPPYPAPFRQQMIELVAAGRKPSELAREFGCHETSITNWVRAAHQASATSPVPAGALSAAERQELHELRRKLRQVQQERDILAKATAWFANKGEQTFTPSMR
jgi:transposase